MQMNAASASSHFPLTETVFILLDRLTINPGSWPSCGCHLRQTPLHSSRIGVRTHCEGSGSKEHQHNGSIHSEKTVPETRHGVVLIQWHWAETGQLNWVQFVQHYAGALLTHTGSLLTLWCVTFQVKSVQFSAWFVCLLLPYGWGKNIFRSDHVLLHDHLPVWRWMQSGGDAAYAGCSPCRWSRTQPAGGGPPVWLSPNCWSSCCCRDSPRPPGGKKTPGWAVSCPRIWSRTPPLVTVGQRERELH